MALSIEDMQDVEQNLLNAVKKIVSGAVNVGKAAEEWIKNKSRFKDVVFTVVEEETYTYGNDVTTKPLEDGSVVSDHVQNKPITIHLTGIITGEGEYPQEQLDLLRRYCIQGVVDQYYGVQTLWNFVITSFENKHTADVGDGCAFTMDLQQVLTAKKEVVNILTSDITIPDIQALKDQMQAQQKVTAEIVRSRVVAPTRTTKQAKQVTTSSSKSKTTKTKAPKQTVLEKIKAMY